MHKISKRPTEIFLHIMEMMKEEQHLKIDNGSYMPLTVEKVGENISTPFGIASMVSFAHYHQQHGDAVRDPEVVFLFVDNRAAALEKIPGLQKSELLDFVAVYPQSYTQDNMGMYQELITIEGNKAARYSARQQKSCASFCTMWFNNIKKQQKL